MKLYDIIAEEKTRLDPACWTGKKIGNPKTKVKGGVRVNNCVPAESVAEDVVTDFVTRGGQIQQGKLHKPRKGETWQGSSHIGAAGGRGTKGTVSGRAANTNPKGGKPVVTAEDSLNELGVKALSSYGKKAEKSNDKKLDKAADHTKKATDLYAKGTASAVAKSFDHEDQANKLHKQVNKRNASMDQAAGKLKNKMSKGVAEEVEEAVESPFTSYKKPREIESRGGSGIKQGTRYGGGKQKDVPTQDEAPKTKKPKGMMNFKEMFGE